MQALLRRKRILVIVDALSERSAETQRHVQRLYGADTPINAMIVTTRREPDFGPVERTSLYPQPIDLRLLVPFIMEYLKRQNLARSFDARQQLALAQRILQIVETGGLAVTPLLVTLFVDAAVARVALSAVEELPIDVPEIYLDYLERLNPTDAATPNRVEHEVLHKAALVLAKASLGDELVPTDFRRDDAEMLLCNAGLTSARALIDRLVSNGVVQERVVAGLGILRFQLDPVAEYLAAIAACRDLSSNRAAWQEFIVKLVAMPTYPEVIRGFLTALSVCYVSYKVPLRLPELDLPWTTLQAQTQHLNHEPQTVWNTLTSNEL